MSDALSPEEKAMFARATQRRKENGVRLKRIFLQAEESQVAAFYELYNCWVERWGKTRALDEIIRFMAIVESRLQDKERANNRPRS